MKNKYKTEQVRHPILGVMTVEDYLTTTEKWRKQGSLDTALVMLHVLNNYAIKKGDVVLRNECRRRINKYEYNLEDVRYDVESGAAAPINREPESVRNNKNSIISPPKPIGHKTFTFSIEGETLDMKKNRLAQARTVLINGKYMIAEKNQWADLFSGYTNSEKIKWTGEKGHLVYFIKAIKDNIINRTGFGIWEIVAAHFKWHYTYPKSKKTIDEDFDSIKLSQGKAKQTKELDGAAFWFKPEINPNYNLEEKEEKNPYTYDETQTDSEKEYDAWSNGLRLPSEELQYPNNESDQGFRLSDDY